jgi:hypothetical protein
MEDNKLIEKVNRMNTSFWMEKDSIFGWVILKNRGRNNAYRNQPQQIKGNAELEIRIDR